MAENNLLSIQNLTTHFFTEDGVAKAVQDVSFDIPHGKTVAVVGESGCGKSVTSLSVLRLVPNPPGKIMNGEIYFRGENLFHKTEKQMRRIRGNDIAIIFQEPMTSLNPVYTVGNQIIEVIRLHQGIKGAKAWEAATKMLRQVGIADPEKRVREYPHQLSGGMRQRVMIAMALSCNPALLIADEPTTALDVTIQAQILELLRELQAQHNMSIMLITHDLGVVAENSDHVVVMYASRVAEKADAEPLFHDPLHPYTKGLLTSLPRLGEEKERLDVIGGSVPNPLNFPSGCKFHPRCSIGNDDPRCRSEEPELREVEPGRCVACWYARGYETEQEFKEYEAKYGKHKQISG
ncbi:Stage 0 sporulation protein KD [Anaerohalosphaera lusitana]|uniref:Stage 0 sporulation protein KD n=1 Tax=Anaerohalosphaera lusitana TaxID=1936003 RepID=A0A1U9NN95_9BACT|nr:ABC transporter ATP-binding protein [Anaerohalosphaera lusitana]AQT69373.1 Stage 0 sporulation protein KD [Anaerohalosphaera lusitana]